MEDHRGLIGILEHQLLQDIEDDGEDDDAKGHDANLGRSAQLVEMLGRGSRHLLEEAHNSSDCEEERRLWDGWMEP